MRAVRNTEKGIQVVEVPPPTGDGVRVWVKAAGICRSDLTMLEMGLLKHTIGHEIAGFLDEGEAVALQPITPCDSCELCQAGEYQLCSTCVGSTLGLYRDGGMAEEIIVDQRCLVPLAPTVDVANACLVEPLAVAIHGIDRVGIVDGQRVAIVGAGTIGLMAAATARSHGCDVDVVARHEAQRRSAETLGAGNQPKGQYDLVIDAAGTPDALARAVELCRPGGGLLLLAWDWGSISLPGLAVATKEIRIRATIAYGHQSAVRDVDAAASLLALQPEIANAVISHRFPLDEAAQAFAVARDRKGGAIKVVLEP